MFDYPFSDDNDHRCSSQTGRLSTWLPRPSGCLRGRQTGSRSLQMFIACQNFLLLALCKKPLFAAVRFSLLLTEWHSAEQRLRCARRRSDEKSAFEQNPEGESVYFYGRSLRKSAKHERIENSGPNFSDLQIVFIWWASSSHCGIGCWRPAVILACCHLIKSAQCDRASSESYERFRNRSEWFVMVYQTNRFKCCGAVCQPNHSRTSHWMFAS